MLQWTRYKLSPFRKKLPVERWLIHRLNYSTSQLQTVIQLQTSINYNPFKASLIRGPFFVTQKRNSEDSAVTDPDLPRT